MLRIDRRDDGVLQAKRDGEVVVSYHKDNTSLLTPLSEELSLNSMMGEMNERSITPTTFDSLEIESTDAAFYIEKYVYGEDEVSHFGINNIISSEEVSDAILACGGLAPAGYTVLSPSSGKKTKFPAIVPTTLEVDLLNQAITHLFSLDIKVVLVDIFPRHKYDGDHGKIVGSNNMPDVHSILLYKNGASEILVIDPSNFKFSDHLAAAYNGIEVKTCRADIKIYKAYTNDVGKEFIQYRDCTDIAVKLAFQLNKEDIVFQILDAKALEKSIKTCVSIQRLSNDPGLDSNILTDNTVVTRIKQSSDFRVVKLFYKIESLIKMHRDYLKDSDSFDLHKVRVEKIFNTEENYHNAILQLYEFKQESVTEIDTELQQEMVALGMVVESSCCASCVIS